MKHFYKLIILISCCLIIRSSMGNELQQPISLEELSHIKINYSDCSSADSIINFIKYQLSLKNLLGKEPETLTEYQRKYNEKAHIIIWSLIVGCNNPNRYSK